MSQGLTSVPHPLSALGFSEMDWASLHDAERLADMQRSFLEFLAQADAELAQGWQAYSEGRDELDTVEESRLLIEVARQVSRFIGQLFSIEGAQATRRDYIQDRRIVYRLAKEFVKKRVRRAKTEGVDPVDTRARAERLLGRLAGMEGADNDEEERFAGRVLRLLDRGPTEVAATGGDETVEEALELLALDLSLRQEAGDPQVASWRSLRELRPLVFADGLVETHDPLPVLPEAHEGPPDTRRRRDGFKLTDSRATVEEVLNEVDQCLFCHAREKDSCHKGLYDKKSGELEKNPLGVPLKGCPLDERISEMHELYDDGDPVAALAMVMIDNPMVPGTGHRICNDCMKSCIYQKQEPVNIPQIETRVLTDTLELPYGTEIFLLLTRWNPLNVERTHALPYNGINVLVVGLGPAGYCLAHYLCQEGFGVVGIDGLKVEPLNPEWSGAIGPFGGLGDGEHLPVPIDSWEALQRELDERILLGFGGVSEYGITVRWDKNFLTLPYLSLLRRQHCHIMGGVRFGGTLELEDAWKAGFDHVAIATGAGKPTVVPMKNNLACGVRKASDFLMALQLTGAFKRDALANLTLRLPVLVIGGGLTGVDTATESLAYYPVQVEKMTRRYDVLCGEFGEDTVRGFFRGDETTVLDELLTHGRAVIAERERAQRNGQQPDFASLVRAWGGVRLVYRKGLEDAPAYRLNHEEITKAFEEGITIVELMSPVEAKLDDDGTVEAVIFERQQKTVDGKFRGTGELVEMPARTVLVAAGTSPNVTYEREHPGTFELDERGRFFQVHRDQEGQSLPLSGGWDVSGPGFFSSYDDGQHSVSIYGDNHPAYAGNVVKAMASARDGYHHVVDRYSDRIAACDASPQALTQRKQAWQAMVHRLDSDLVAVVHEVNRLTPTITEVVVHAPAAARKFQPGQFFRLQNYETDAPTVDGTRLLLEGIALTGAWTDVDRGLLGMIVLEMGVTSRLCASLEPGQPVVVMGPTGAPTEVPTGEKVILAGGGLGNAVLFSIGRAMRAAGNEVIYFGAFKCGEDLFKREEIESAADAVIWSTDTGGEIAISPDRPLDRHFRGNVVQAMIAYAEGQLGETGIALDECDRLICIGSDRMMNAVRQARHAVLQPYLKPGHIAIGSINSPMQCMMKMICAQCLVKHVDPDTGAETEPVFSCFNQDQHLDCVDFENLAQRLRQNTVQEKLTNLWLDHLVRAGGLDLWTLIPPEAEALRRPA